MSKSNTLTDLKNKLKKLKDKEAALEADLAIREHPELEDGIYDVIVAMATLKRLDTDIRLLETKFDGKKLEQSKTQLEFYRKKVENLEGKDTPAAIKMIDYYKRKMDVMGGAKEKRKIPTHDGLLLKRERALSELESAVKLWAPKFREYGFNFKLLLPSICDYVDA